MLLLAGLVDVVVQVRVHALADAQACINEDSALFEGNVRARHSGHGFAFRVGDELAHPHGFVGAAFDLPILVLAQSLVPPHVAESVDGSNRRGNEVVRRHGLVDKDIDDGEGEPPFACVNGYTGEEASYRVSDLPVGTVILVEDENVGDVVFARSVAVNDGWWRVVVQLGDECRCGAPSVDDLVPGSSGRLPVVYLGVG